MYTLLIYYKEEFPSLHRGCYVEVMEVLSNFYCHFNHITGFSIEKAED